MPSTTGGSHNNSSSSNQDPTKMKAANNLASSVHVRLPSTDSGIQADAGGFDSLSRYKGKHFLSSSSGHFVSSSPTSSSSSTSAGGRMDNSSSLSSSSSHQRPMSTSGDTDITDDPHSHPSILSPCSSSSGYNSETTRGGSISSPPPSLPPRMPRDFTPPRNAASSATSSPFHSQDSSSSMPSSMTSSWAGMTSFSKSKPKPEIPQLPPSNPKTSITVVNSKDTAGFAGGKLKSSIHIPPKPKLPPPKRPLPNSHRPTSASSAIKMATSTQDGGVHVSISRTQPTPSDQKSSVTQNSNSRTTSQSSEVSSNKSQAKNTTTIDVRPSPGSTVKVKVISGGGASDGGGSSIGLSGSRPQPQPRSNMSHGQSQTSSTTSPSRLVQGQGCIPLTRPLRMAVPPPPTAALRRVNPRLGAMSQPPPPPPHSEQLQHLHQRHPQQQPVATSVSLAGGVAKPRPLGPKPQISPRKNPPPPPRPSSKDNTSNRLSGNGGDIYPSRLSGNFSSDCSSVSMTTATTTTTTSSMISINAIATTTNTSTVSQSATPYQSSTTAPKSTTTSSSGSINIPMSSQPHHSTSLKKNAPPTNHNPIKSQHYNNPVYNGTSVSASSTSSPPSVSSPNAISDKNSVDSCTFMFKSPEKSFFTQTFYTKDKSGKHTPTTLGERVVSPSSSPGLTSSLSSGRLGTSSDHRHLGFIRDDLKAGDKQSRMRHAELIQKRSDELFQDAWSFLNASEDEIDRCFFGDDFFSSHSPSPDRTHLNPRERAKVTPDPSKRHSDTSKPVNNDVTLKASSNGGQARTGDDGTKTKSSLNQLGIDQGESVPWKIRKERIDTALSWLKQELASLRDMDKNIVSQFRRCQDTIETLKNQREIWEGLSEEGEEAEYWDDLEINEFNRNYINSPEGSSLSPMSTGSRDLGFQEVSTEVSLPFPSSPSHDKANGAVTQDVEATL